MFSLTERQEAAQSILAGDAKHIMLFGGSRSGKTFLLMRNIVMRALKAPGSRHGVFRFRQNAIRQSIFSDTFPKVMRLAFPSVPVEINKTEMTAKLPRGSEIVFSGLDDAERVEKILGMEFVTVYFNECSQIPYQSIQIAQTRLAQKVNQVMEGRPDQVLRPRGYYDQNPPSKAHWSYQVFVKKVDPETGRGLAKPDEYASFKISPEDNAANISDDYLDTLRGMSARMRLRFLDGEFADATPGALFTDETIEKHRVSDGGLPDMVRVVVAVDPSGAGDVDNADNDAIGIVVAGLGIDGVAYVLEDLTVKAGPATWGNIATTAFDRHQANCIVAETNYGGAMVTQTIQASRPRTPVRTVTASRGKHVRAEPFSALYEAGKVRHVGEFREMEAELTAFSTYGYSGGGSPNRADALIWALAELFPGLTRPRTDTQSRPAVIVPKTVTGFNRR
jgi:hypothetical protein